MRVSELTVVCETLRAKMLAGEAVNPDSITRLESTRDRAERALDKIATAKSDADADDWGKVSDEADKIAADRKERERLDEEEQCQKDQQP